jgi:hypothetical protein
VPVLVDHSTNGFDEFAKIQISFHWLPTPQSRTSRRISPARLQRRNRIGLQLALIVAGMHLADVMMRPFCRFRMGVRRWVKKDLPNDGIRRHSPARRLIVPTSMIDNG